jgi:hypothetical protein
MPPNGQGVTMLKFQQEEMPPIRVLDSDVVDYISTLRSQLADAQMAIALLKRNKEGRDARRKEKALTLPHVP